MTKIEWAAWAAALGTFLAAVAAVGTASWSHRNEMRRDRLRTWEGTRDQTLRDLDETRRLLIVAIARPEALASPEMFGTIVHALDKHSHVMDAKDSVDVLMMWWKHGTGGQLQNLVLTIDERLELLRKKSPLTPFDFT